MSIKKSLLAVAAMALALMGFASSAMASGGFIRDVTDTKLIANGAVLHAVGWAKFEGEPGSVECHVTTTIQAVGATGSTGNVTNFSVPDVTKCKFGGFLAFCSLKSETTTNLPYHITATPTDFDVTGKIVLDNSYGGFCPVSSQVVEFEKITVTPVATGTKVVTNTAGKLGTTAVPGTKTNHSKPSGVDKGDPIAGFHISGTGKAEGLVIHASGELELTSDTRCTYYLSTD